LAACAAQEILSRGFPALKYLVIILAQVTLGVWMISVGGFVDDFICFGGRQG
jgi:hypothetical protein